MNKTNIKHDLTSEANIITKTINAKEHFDEIETLEGSFSFKTCDHKIVHCNKKYLSYSGFKSVDSLVGITDLDLPWQQYSHIYHAQEDDALQGRLYSALHPAQGSDGRVFVCFDRKMPWSDEEGRILGVASYAIEVDNPNLIEIANLLNSTAICKPETDHLLCDTFAKVKMTPRETECLFYLLHGKTSKQIANILMISSRTVESYIETLKIKFNCNTKSDLIDFCVKNDFVKIVPSTIFSKKLIKTLKD